MDIEITASKVDPLYSGNAQVIKIICDEDSYTKALEIIDTFTNKR